MSLKNKRVLITAGPTWVAIDDVRVISNIATGETGILLANKLTDLDVLTTLVLGPVGACCLDKSIKLIRFRFFEELKNKLAKELAANRYDVVIHSAAVSDYRPGKKVKGKIKSDLKECKLKLIRTPKLIDLIKKISPSAFLVGFKFEMDPSKGNLIRSAERLLNQAQLDCVVANTTKENKYQAYIVGRNKVSSLIRNKKELTRRLIKVIQKNFL
jgi:phosphopantothenoylcysteine decarboxylase/phosphopantothenate--cysteine ligase